MITIIQEYRSRLFKLDKFFSECKEIQKCKVSEKDILDLIFGDDNFDILLQTIEPRYQLHESVVVPFQKKLIHYTDEPN